jgi:hypothetical protein
LLTPDADQLEQRMLDDFGDHDPADKTRAPDHDWLGVNANGYASPNVFHSTLVKTFMPEPSVFPDCIRCFVNKRHG